MHKTDRRVFIKAGLAIGAVGVVESTGIGRALAAAAARPDIVAVKGTDAFASTIKALEALGGMKLFDVKGTRVGLLINAPPHWKLEGSHTRMEVALAVAKMCIFKLVAAPSLPPAPPASGDHVSRKRGGNVVARCGIDGLVVKWNSSHPLSDTAQSDTAQIQADGNQLTRNTRPASRLKIAATSSRMPITSPFPPPPVQD
jgi:hypothetical protein